jgi:hypothetical protein
MTKKEKLIRLDSFVTIYLKPNGELDAEYHSGGGKTVISAEDMGKYDSAYTINVSHIIEPVKKLEKNEFTRKEVAEVISLNDRMVKFYADEGLVEPGIDPGKGRGKVRRFSKRDVVDFALIKRMAAFNIKIKKIREFLEWFRKPALGIMDRYTGGMLRRIKD